MSTATVRYTWSRFSHNPVEHVADDSMFTQPICGTRLKVEFQHVAEHPSGLAPLCLPCQRKLARGRLRLAKETNR